MFSALQEQALYVAQKIMLLNQTFIDSLIHCPTKVIQSVLVFDLQVKSCESLLQKEKIFRSD